MKQYDFDQNISRYGTNSLKYDFAVENGYPEDVLPLWVADMDFRTAEPILDAMRERVDHGIFGYCGRMLDYYEAAAAWFSGRYHWQTQPSWLVTTPGVVFALATAVRALTKPGESVLIQPPVYYPFFSVVEKNGRKIVENRLIYRDGAYTVDFEDFERKAVENDVKLFILCSPHNPVGRVWTAEELRRMGEICRKYHIFVVADEIHCDFAFPEHPHHTLLEAIPELAEQAVVCTSPSKTFNLAGLQVSNIWIPGESVRKQFNDEIDRCGVSRMNVMGLVAGKTAYEKGGEWLDQCLRYLRGNLDFLREFLAGRIPQIKLVEPEGTYLAWLDCSGLGLSQEELNSLIVDRAKLWLDAGHIFGKDAGQFQRIVLACPRTTLERALLQLEQAVKIYAK